MKYPYILIFADQLRGDAAGISRKYKRLKAYLASGWSYGDTDAGMVIALKGKTVPEIKTLRNFLIQHGVKFKEYHQGYVVSRKQHLSFLITRSGNSGNGEKQSYGEGK